VHDQIADLQLAEIREKRPGDTRAGAWCVPLLLEDIGFRVDLQARLGQPESTTEAAHGNEHRSEVRLLGMLDRHRHELVFPQNLDRPLRTASTARDKEHLFAAGTGRTYVGDPIGDAAPKLDDRLRSHFPDRLILVVLNGDLEQAWSRLKAATELVPAYEGTRWFPEVHRASSYGIGVAGVELRARPSGVLLDEVRLRHDDVHPACGRHAIEHRPELVVIVKTLSHRYDSDLIQGSDGPLGCRIEPAERFDHVADELDSNGIVLTCRKYVDNPTANSERPVFVDRILTRKPGIHQQIS
jgi:hypothetical protein